MESTVRTIYGSHIETCRRLNRPFNVLPNSTLNQKFSLFENTLPGPNEYPVMGYIAIGNKGASYEVTADNYVLTTPLPHLPRDASLYNFLPFVMRTIDNDLDSTERMKYRLRVPMVVNGSNYVAYYLKTLPIANVTPTVELRNVNGDSITSAVFTPSVSDLSPTPPDISTTNLNNPSGDYLVSTAKVEFVLDQVDISNIMDACAILYGDPRYAVINEIALCTGIDKVVQGTFGGTTSNYTDTVATQVAAFISQYHALSPSTTEVRITLDIGAVEPLLV